MPRQSQATQFAFPSALTAPGLPVQQGQQSQPIITDPQPLARQHPKTVVLFRLGFFLYHQCVFLGLL